jgi:hypothetical protein
MIQTWIWRDNLMPILDLLASVAGYQLDSYDSDAITEGVRGTDCDADRWFEFEFTGRVKFRVRIADDPGTNVRMLKVESPSDCNEIISTLFEVAQRYRLSVV